MQGLAVHRIEDAGVNAPGESIPNLEEIERKVIYSSTRHNQIKCIEQLVRPLTFYARAVYRPP